MIENPFSEADWQALDDEIQLRFHAFAIEIQAAALTADPRFGKTVTPLMPLFSYVSFQRPHLAEAEYVIVGVHIIAENGHWRIDADISDEEEGAIFFELPATPFQAATLAEFKDRVLRKTEQLIKEGKPVLLRLFGASSAIMPAQAVGLPISASKP